MIFIIIWIFHCLMFDVLIFTNIFSFMFHIAAFPILEYYSLELGRGVSSPKDIKEDLNERVHTTNILVQSGGHTRTMLKEGKVITESPECPNLVFGVNTHIHTMMATS